jgi:hypothetical protein
MIASQHAWQDRSADAPIPRRELVGICAKTGQCAKKFGNGAAG